MENKGLNDKHWEADGISAKKFKLILEDILATLIGRIVPFLQLST
jgi:hypothetical protein